MKCCKHLYPSTLIYRNNAPLQPIPQKPYYDPPKANPILESIEQTAARARQQAQRPFLEPLSGPLPDEDVRANSPSRQHNTSIVSKMNEH